MTKRRALSRAVGFVLVSVMLFLMLSPSAFAEKPSQTYEKAQDALAVGDYDKAAALFESIGDYADAAKMAVYARALSLGEQGKYADAVAMLAPLGDFKGSARLAFYYSLCKLAFSGGATLGDLFGAAEQFDAISSFRDSAAYAEKCRKLIYAEAEKRFNNKDYEGAWRIFNELGSFEDSAQRAEACVGAVVDMEYTAAVALMDAGKYEEAISGFWALNGYKDSAQRLEACWKAVNDKAYAAAVALKDAGKYPEAIEAFEALNGYKDSAAQAEACRKAISENAYAAAATLKNVGKYLEAIAAFEGLNGYKDSKAQAELCREKAYAAALSLLESGDRVHAAVMFTALGSYRDAARMAYLASVDGEILDALRRLDDASSRRESLFGGLLATLRALTDDPDCLSLSESGSLILSSSLLFAPGSPELRPEAAPLLDALSDAFAAFLADGKKRQIVDSFVISAHTDSDGSAAENRRLSAEQASAVLDRLLEGRDQKLADHAALFCATGCGEARPLAQNDSPEGRAQNRRIEISLLLSEGYMLELARQVLAGPDPKAASKAAK